MSGSRSEKFKEIRRLESLASTKVSAPPVKPFSKPITHDKNDSTAALFISKRFDKLRGNPVSDTSICQFIAALRVQGVQVGQEAYTTAFSVLRREQGYSDSATAEPFINMIDDMISNGLVPNTKIYASLIKFFTTNDEIVNQFLGDMQQRDIKIDVWIWDALIAKSALEKDLETTWACYKMMIRETEVRNNKTLVPRSVFMSMFSVATDFESQVRCVLTMERFYKTPPPKEFMLSCIWNHCTTEEQAVDLLHFCSKRNWFQGNTYLFMFRMRMFRFRNFLGAKRTWQMLKKRDANAYSIMISGVASFVTQKDDLYLELLEKLIKEATEFQFLDRQTMFHVASFLQTANPELCGKYREGLHDFPLNTSKAKHPWEEEWRPAMKPHALDLSRDDG